MTIDEAIEDLKECDSWQVAEWLEELKELRKLKETYAKGMETSYAEFRYKQGRADVKKEINEIMDMDVPISNILYEIDKWIKEQNS